MTTSYTADRFIRILFGILIVTCLSWLVWYFYDIIIYFALGTLVAYLLNPVVNRLQGFGLHRVIAIFVTFLSALTVLVLLLLLFVPPLFQQTISLSETLQSGETIRDIATSFETYLNQFFPITEGTLIQSFESGFVALFEQGTLITTIASLADLFANLFYAFLVAPLVTFFVLKDGLKMREFLLRMVPNKYFEIVLQTLEKIESNLGRYFRGLFLQSICVGFVATVLLWIIGLDNAILIGIFAGIANTIPYFGPLVGLLAGSITGFSQTGDFSLFIGVFLAMAITQVTDNAFLQPFIFSRVAKTHPIVILGAVLIGAQLGGIVGMLVAIPVLTVIRVVVEQIFWSLRNYRIFAHHE